jgi:hypothetical protein
MTSFTHGFAECCRLLRGRGGVGRELPALSIIAIQQPASPSEMGWPSSFP